MDSISQIFDRFTCIRALVVGDLMVDEHVWGVASRVSPEAPVLVVDAQGEPEVLPGGAANVVNNIRALGGNVSVVGIIGDDLYGHELDRQLFSSGVDTSGLVLDSDRLTTRKTRIWVSHRQQVVRVDRESRLPLSDGLSEQILSKVRSKLSECDVIVMSDYNKGVLAPNLSAEIIGMARKSGKICTANPKPVNIMGFRGAELVALNQSEAENVAQMKLDDDVVVLKTGKRLLSELDLNHLVITRGAAGLVIFGDQLAEMVAAVPIEVYDVAGAGDTVISAISLALAAGAEPLNAARIGNLAGGAAVRKVGVAAITREEIQSLACMLDD